MVGTLRRKTALVDEYLSSTSSSYIGTITTRNTNGPRFGHKNAPPFRKVRQAEISCRDIFNDHRQVAETEKWQNMYWEVGDDNEEQMCFLRF